MYIKISSTHNGICLCAFVITVTVQPYVFVYDKFTDIRQHNKYVLEYLGYMFRPVKRSSSGHQYSESEVLFRYWDPWLGLLAKSGTAG